MNVTVTGIEGQSRTNDDLPDRPLRVRYEYEQKATKYGLIVERSCLPFVPTVFSQTGQSYGPFKS